MGCDYYIDEKEEKVVIEVIDYATGEFLDRVVVDAERFEDGKMDVVIKGAERR